MALVVGSDQGHDAELADACRDVDTTEINYYRAVHLLAGALWLQGRATQALSALSGLLDGDGAREQGT